MPWKASSVMDERMKFVGRLLSGEKMAPLCREFGISRVTGHKIWTLQGGDEFTILLEDNDDPDDAVVSAERILNELNAPFKLLKHQLQISASIGIALGDDGSQARELIHNSDMAMYAAKRAGKNRYELFDPTREHRRLVLVEPPNSISESDVGSRSATHEPAPDCELPLEGNRSTVDSPAAFRTKTEAAPSTSDR